MVTPHHSHDNGYVSLAIEHLSDLPEQIKVDEKVLFRKGEFHISLMALKHLVPLINTGTNNVTEDDIVQDFVEYQANNDLSHFRPANTFRYVTRGERETVVAMVDVPNIEGLFEYIRTKYRVSIPTQPTHITLYTLQPEAAIGILSNNELEANSTPINVPEIKLG